MTRRKVSEPQISEEPEEEGRVTVVPAVLKSAGDDGETLKANMLYGLSHIPVHRTCGHMSCYQSCKSCQLFRHSVMSGLFPLF